MHMEFSPAELAFRDEVREFFASHLPAHLREASRATLTVFAEPEIGREWQRILYEKGWLAYQWPKEYGGTGWSPVERYIFEKECALADAPPLPALGLRLFGPVIYTFGTAEQKVHYLPKVLSGEHYWCQGFSEPGAGSDLAHLKTRAVRNGDHYVLNGSKIWTTHAHHADHMFCLARTDSTVQPQRGISFLLIDMRQRGVTVRPIRSISGDHEVNEVFLDNAIVPEGDLVGAEGQGWSIAKFLLENERGGSCHAPRLLTDIARLRQRAANGHSDLAFATKLARLELEAQALETTELRILAQLACGEPPGPQSSLVKLVASNLRQSIDSLALKACGYAGLQLAADRPLYGNASAEPILGKEAQLAAPRYLNSRAWTIFGGSNEIQRMIIAKTVLHL
jgi:alkylation response protein AidB-like acyl-CoA dehydrogenase